MIMSNTILLKGWQRVCKTPALAAWQLHSMTLSRTKKGSLSPEFPQLVALTSNSKTKKGQSLLVLLQQPAGFWYMKDRAFEASGVEAQTGERQLGACVAHGLHMWDLTLIFRKRWNAISWPALSSLWGSFGLLYLFSPHWQFNVFLSCLWWDSVISLDDF